MMIFLRRQIFLLLIVLFKLTESDRKSKRTKEYRPQPPIYEISRTNYLPSDSQVTAFLLKGELNVFYYLSPIDNGSLSTTIITCSSPIQWSMKLSEKNTTVHPPSDKLHNQAFVTVDMTTEHFIASKELYVLQLIAKEFDTFVHIYISTESEGSQALRNAHLQKLRLQKRQRRKRLTIRWDASLVDPQGTHYCLTVSPKKNYKTLCSAQAERFGIRLPSTTKPLAAFQTVTDWRKNDLDSNSEKTVYPLIACVGRKRQYTVSNLKKGQTYFFDLFATNKQSNLTYFFGSASTVFDSRNSPIPLRDGKSMFANLRKFDGKIVFRFKMKNQGNPLNIFIIPCGAIIDAEVTLNGKTIASRERIAKFGHLVINPSAPSGRYYIKVVAVNLNREDLSRNSGVEVLATSKPSSKIPLPTMPSQTTVEEIPPLRRCDSVTVAWIPSPGRKMGHYCIVVKEGKIREVDDYGITNQCTLENRLKKSVDFVVKYCRDFPHNSTMSAITEKIGYLKPGKSYIVQVTVKKPKGKSLGYDLLQVHTTPTCHMH